MTTNTILLIILSLIIAGGLSYYQYFYRSATKGRLKLLLAGLRFVAILSLLLLLINPVITRNSYQAQKPPLALVLDNSQSVAELKADQAAKDVFEKIRNNRELAEKFEIQTYQFDNELTAFDAPDFKGAQTNVEEVSKGLKSINRNRSYPTVIITDGNQTSGSDYVYSFANTNKVFPVVAGDTTTFLDLRINRLNVNKYAFQGNKFPVEVFLQYSGDKPVEASFLISNGNNVIQKQSVRFSASQKTATINVLLPAEKTGLQIFRASVTSPEKEKNTYNNSKNFAVEVIDQKTEVAIVSTITHPDVGAFKRSIQNNAQRRVSILKPNEFKDAAGYDVVILYQPSAAFRSVYEILKNAGTNTFTVTGTATDFNFLNLQQSELEFRMSGQSEDYVAAFNDQFNLFALDNIGFESLPPLQHAFGTVTSANGSNVLLSSKIRNITANMPQLVFFEGQGRRSAYLLGENIWRWRLQTHVEHQSFEKFDIFVDKIVQFLVSNNKKRSLIVNHESFYNSGDPVDIVAQFFNKNYEFDERARLTITVTNKGTKSQKRYDMLRGGNSFNANLDGLPAGKYSFTVKELNSNSSYNGYFEILDFNIEKQFVNPNLASLLQLASETGGTAFMPDQADRLISTLLQDQSYKTVEKNITTKIPLVDWIWLLVLIVAALASEWFIRKYNGML